jgi:hypothetical protein
MVALKFDYGTCRLKDLRIQTTRTALGKEDVTGLELKGERLRPSKRFWTSLQMRFGFTPNIFRYFSHAEVFRRISERCADDSVGWCVERKDNKGTLLAVTNPRTATVDYGDLKNLLRKHGAEESTYSNGVIRSTHALRHDVPFQVAGDDFRSKYVIDTPIDGFGRPAVYLAMLRLICSNGAIAVTPVFRSELNCGKGTKGATFALERAIEGFNNEDGFSALRQRFESASRSWASVAEAQKLCKAAEKLILAGELGKDAGRTRKNGLPAADGPVMGSFHKMTGDVGRLYGLSNVDTLSVKRQRTLPTACRVYDLINFASELATHRAGETGARHLQSYIGDLVSGEYDLEGTADTFGDWRDFFVRDAAAIETRTRMQ